MRNVLIFAVLLTTLSCGGISVQAETLSIFEIQYSTAEDGASPRHGEVVDCVGGIVTHKRTENPPRLFLQDPIIRDANVQDVNCCWGAIQVKDWFYGTFDDVNIGDWVAFTNVTVEDYRGTTFLQYWNANPDHSTPGFSVVSSGNAVPEPVAVNIEAIVSPFEDIYDPGCWYVQDHRAEKYESMRLSVMRVVVTEQGNGKAGDNYTLASTATPEDANFSCWAADYLNKDRVGYYHPYVEIDQEFCRVQGILEQYKNLSTGWDYYQLLTTKTEDFLITQTADFDDDCDVDFGDFGHFANYWLVDCHSDLNLCGGADIEEDYVVDVNDLGELVYCWLDGVEG